MITCTKCGGVFLTDPVCEECAAPLLADPSFLPCVQDTVEYILYGPGRKTVNNRIYRNALELKHMLRDAERRDKATTPPCVKPGSKEVDA